MQISDAVFNFWIKKEWSNAETVLTEEIMQSSSPSYHALANRALIRANLEQWLAAQHDAEEVFRSTNSVRAYILTYPQVPRHPTIRCGSYCQGHGTYWERRRRNRNTTI